MLYLTGRTSFVIPLKSVFQLPTTAKRTRCSQRDSFCGVPIIMYIFSCRHCALGLAFCLRLSHGMVPLNHFCVSITNKNKPIFSSKFISYPSRCFTDRQEHSSDVGARLWRRLIYPDADRTALSFKNLLGCYSNLLWAQSLPLGEHDKGRTTKIKQGTERTWSGSKEQCRRRKTKTVRASTSPSATWWTTVSRSKYKIY